MSASFLTRAAYNLVFCRGVSSTSFIAAPFRCLHRSSTNIAKNIVWTGGSAFGEEDRPAGTRIGKRQCKGCAHRGPRFYQGTDRARRRLFRINSAKDQPVRRLRRRSCGCAARRRKTETKRGTSGTIAAAGRGIATTDNTASRSAAHEKPPSGHDRKRAKQDERCALTCHRREGPKTGPCLTDAAPEAAPDRAVRKKPLRRSPNACRGDLGGHLPRWFHAQLHSSLAASALRPT